MTILKKRKKNRVKARGNVGKWIVPSPQFFFFFNIYIMLRPTHFFFASTTMDTLATTSIDFVGHDHHHHRLWCHHHFYHHYNYHYNYITIILAIATDTMVIWNFNEIKCFFFFFGLLSKLQLNIEKKGNYFKETFFY